MQNMQANLERLRRGEIPQVSIGAVDANPVPDERAVLILARCFQYQEDPDYAVVSWANQVKAQDFHNNHGLLKTLDKILELDPNGLDN